MKLELQDVEAKLIMDAVTHFPLAMVDPRHRAAMVVVGKIQRAMADEVKAATGENPKADPKALPV
jgi:hypothetical protein